MVRWSVKVRSALEEASASLPEGDRAAFTSALTRARDDGYIVKDVGDDLRVIAAPIFEGGHVGATVGVIGLAAHLSGDLVTDAVGSLVEQAGQISDIIGQP